MVVVGGCLLTWPRCTFLFDGVALLVTRAPFRSEMETHAWSCDSY